MVSLELTFYPITSLTGSRNFEFAAQKKYLLSLQSLAPIFCVHLNTLTIPILGQKIAEAR